MTPFLLGVLFIGGGSAMFALKASISWDSCGGSEGGVPVLDGEHPVV